LAEVRRRLDAAEDAVPRCDCGEPLKPDVTLFGELLDETAMTRASALAAGADLMLCVGSSLEVYPAAGLPELTLEAGGRIAVITRSETPFDRFAVVRLGGDVEEELGAVMAALANFGH
jgi:NAD-dependent deacetylase